MTSVNTASIAAHLLKPRKRKRGSKYLPHQSKRECDRRVRQLAESKIFCDVLQNVKE